MRYEELSLEHETVLKDKLESLGDGLSEYCFSNLYLFRQIHKYQVVFDDRIFIKGKTYDGFSHLMPVFDLTEVSARYLIDVINGFDFFFPVSETMLKNFSSNLFTASYNADDSDYIYSSEKLKTYKGRKLGKKKNLMKQFLKNFTSEIYPLSRDRIADAENILRQWQEDVRDTVEKTDFYPCLEALSYLEVLDLFGYIYYVNNEPGGFLLAKKISSKMCVFHFAKGKRKFKGIFQYMFNHFANIHSNKFSYYNFEQDLGNPNFRKTKQSYFPDTLLKKYRVKPKYR